MTELLNALEALERLGASWKARRMHKQFLYDTIECTSLVQAGEGVIRGLVEVHKLEDLCRIKMEVVCYLDDKLDEKGEFKHLKHSKDKTAKIFEYKSEVFYRYLKVFGIALGWRPESRISDQHQYLVDFAERLVVEFDHEKIASKAAKAAKESTRKSANEARARKALFG